MVAPNQGGRMFWFIFAQLRRRAGRASALLAGVLVATTGFTVLTASAETMRLDVVGEIDANYRAAYDILVRPAGSRTALENGRGLVRPTHLSSQFGGISLAQWHRIRTVTGVDVPAPIAMIGYSTTTSTATLD